MTKELAPQYDPFKLGEVLAKSKYFDDAREAAQAVVKVLAGRELGIGPIASMTGIYVIQGKISLSANLLAGLVKRDPDYDYKIDHLGDDGCGIDFFRGQEKLGRSTFTLSDAKKAGTKNLDKYPRNMLFARALTNGFRWYTPHLAGVTPVYSPEELGAEVNEEGEVINIPAEVVDEHLPRRTDQEVGDQEREDIQRDSAEDDVGKVKAEPKTEDGAEPIGEDGVSRLKKWAAEHDYAWPHVMNKANKIFFQDIAQGGEPWNIDEDILGELTIAEARQLVKALLQKYPNGSGNNKVDRPEGGATEILTPLNVAVNLDQYLQEGHDKQDLLDTMLEFEEFDEDDVKHFLGLIVKDGDVVHHMTYRKILQDIALRVRHPEAKITSQTEGDDG
jgi:hypothetical protein